MVPTAGCPRTSRSASRRDGSLRVANSALPERNDAVDGPRATKVAPTVPVVSPDPFGPAGVGPVEKPMGLDPGVGSERILRFSERVWSRFRGHAWVGHGNE